MSHWIDSVAPFVVKDHFLETYIGVHIKDHVAMASSFVYTEIGDTVVGSCAPESGLDYKFDTRQIRIFSQNVNSDWRLMEGGLYHEAYNSLVGASVRYPQLEARWLREIRENGVKVLSLFEISRHEMLPLIIKFAETVLGKEWHMWITPYNPDPKAMVFVLLVQKTAFYSFCRKGQMPLTTSKRFLSDAEQKSMTKDSIKAHNLDCDFAKSVPMFVFQMSSTSRPVQFWQIHLGLSNKHKIAACEMLADENVAVAKYDFHSVVMAGDWNAFAMGSKGYLQTMGKTLSRFLVLQMDVSKRSSFVAYPYDLKWRMTGDEVAEEAALLASKSWEDLRGLHSRAIDRERKRLESEPEEDFTFGPWKHASTKNPQESLIMDFVVHSPSSRYSVESSLLDLDAHESDHLSLLITIAECE